jgi:hypothetical protein
LLIQFFLSIPSTSIFLSSVILIDLHFVLFDYLTSFFLLLLKNLGKMATRSQVPTDTTPLLGANQPRHPTVTRVPTFMQTSVPNRRSILHAFANITLHMLLELVLPIILYYVFRLFLSPLVSLLLAGVPAAFIVIFKG